MSLQKVDLTTPQPGGKVGEPTKAAWVKFNENVDETVALVEDAAAEGQAAAAQVAALAESLSDAAYMPAASFATAAQGASADSAVQPDQLAATAGALQQDIDTLASAQQTSAIYADTLAALQAVVGTYVGQGGVVVNGTGAGQYRWAGSSWEFLRADILTQKADYGVVVLTSGNIRSQALPRGQAFNGAAMLSEGGVATGFSVPAGSTGATTYLAADLPAVAIRSRRVRITQTYNATEGWLASTGLGAQRAQSLAGTAAAALTVLDYQISQAGTIVTQAGTVDVPANADRIGLMLQLASNASSTSAQRDLTLREAGYTISPLSSPVDTQNDQMLSIRLRPVEDLAQRGLDVAVSTVLTSGDVAAGASPRVTAVNGATVATDASGRPAGFAVPANASGASSYVAADAVAGNVRGRKIKITQRYTATAGWLASTPQGGVRAQALAGGASSNLSVTNYAISQSGTVITQSGEVDVPANADRVGLVLQAAGSAPVEATARSVVIASITYELSAAAGSVETPNDRMLAVRLDSIRSAVGVFDLQSVNAGAGGGYATPAAASLAATSISATKRTDIPIAPGKYSTDYNWTLAPYARLKAKAAARPWLHYELPNGSAEPPANYQPLWIVRNGALDGVKVTARNARYAVHCEASGANPDSTIAVRDCWIEHFGNTLAGWVSQAAWGMGVSSGWTVKSEGTTYRSPFCAFSYHTNRDFVKPSYVENRNDRVIGTAVDGEVAGMAFRAQPLGSRQRDLHLIVGCEVVGDYFYHPSPWMPTTLDYQPAAHTEIEVSGYGNTPFVFRISDFGRALKIASAGGAESSIAVAGSAAAVLFGDVSTFAGVANLPGYVHGSVDVSGAGVGPTNAVFITSLGKRLGDCSTVNKVLTVAVDGAAPLTVTFNQDYTNVTNAVVLAAINAVLGAAAATEYALGNRYRPNIRDEEQTLQNSSAVGIPMGSVLAYNGSYKRVRLMTSADAASLFAGVAWEDIYPGGWGRVKTSGYLPISDVRRTDAAPLAFGSTMSIGATPGVASSGGSQGLLHAIRPDAIEVAR